MSIKKSHSQVLSTFQDGGRVKISHSRGRCGCQTPHPRALYLLFRNIRNVQKGAIVFEKQVNVYLNFSLTLLP